MEYFNPIIVNMTEKAVATYIERNAVAIRIWSTKTYLSALNKLPRTLVVFALNQQYNVPNAMLRKICEKNLS
jgi:hypothetical protein